MIQRKTAETERIYVFTYSEHIKESILGVNYNPTQLSFSNKT